ncbi:putative pentatricopeptide repeat-containing protein At1g12700, mitochondrial [Diospyros lotus]|uniref:putative pentatricopeptide repeat-containing protein At1g12700, mitochondrial n=1 Tax=Diospyros lotus TaxID=55363 RepID=UPI00225101A7|nr:putative pentatricopeptide repeat-containing protein At1g12700, mitochondrial [Diospyros lotus]
MPSSAFLASSLLHSSPSFPQPKTLFIISNHIQSQENNLILFAALPTSTVHSSKGQPSNIILSLSQGTHRFCSLKKVEYLNQTTTVSVAEQQSGLAAKEKANLDFAKGNGGVRVRDLVARIRALPTAERTRIVEILVAGGGFETITDFNDMLMALVTADVPELELALKLSSNLSSFGLFPNCWTYSIMIRCYCNTNEPAEAKRILDQLLEGGFLPSVATFTVLISTFCRGGRVQKAMEVLGIMRRYNCEPTIQTYNCLLKGLCYVGQVESASELLVNIKKSSKKLDIYSYTAVMDGLCKVGRSDEACELLDEALEMGLIPNVATFNTLFTGYCKEGRPLEGIGLLGQMKEINCMPDHISYNTLLFGLLKWGQIHAALQIYKEMIDLGFQVDEKNMNTLLRRLCRGSRTEKGLLKDAYDVFEKMKKWEVVIYDFTNDLVIEAFCRGNDADEALSNLCGMVEVGYIPKNGTFNNVIRALCVDGKLEEALSILAMHGGNTIPSRVAFDILVDEFNRQGRRWDACNIYGAALKLGVTPKRKPKGC